MILTGMPQKDRDIQKDSAPMFVELNKFMPGIDTLKAYNRLWY